MANYNPPKNKIILPLSEVIDAYKRGESVYTIAAKYSASIKPILRVLRENKVGIRKGGQRKGCGSWIKGKRPALDRLDWDEVVRLYESGLSIKKIVSKLHTGFYSVRHILKERGIDSFRKGGNRRGPMGKLWRSKNHRWKGGLSLKRLRQEQAEYKDWRKAVLKRDGNVCALCRVEGKMDIHHILPYRDCDNEKRYDVDNGIALCNPCHKSLRYKEHEYIKLFEEYVRSKREK